MLKFLHRKWRHWYGTMNQTTTNNDVIFGTSDAIEFNHFEAQWVWLGKYVINPGLFQIRFLIWNSPGFVPDLSYWGISHNILEQSLTFWISTDNRNNLHIVDLTQTKQELTSTTTTTTVTRKKHHN